MGFQQGEGTWGQPGRVQMESFGGQDFGVQQPYPPQQNFSEFGGGRPRWEQQPPQNGFQQPGPAYGNGFGGDGYMGGPPGRRPEW